MEWRAGRTQTWDPLETYALQNNLQWKGSYTFDARISKRIRLGRMDLNLFMDIQNVFNSELWGTRGFSSSDDQDRYLKSLKLEMYDDPQYRDEYRAQGMVGGDDTPGDLSSDGKDYIDDPDRTDRMYTNVRNITLGIALNF